MFFSHRIKKFLKFHGRKLIIILRKTNWNTIIFIKNGVFDMYYVTFLKIIALSKELKILDSKSDNPDKNCEIDNSILLKFYNNSSKKVW